MIRDIPGLLNSIIIQLRTQADVAVVGMSGGADSTLVTLLCREAFGKSDVYTVHMPYNDHDHGFFNDRSLKTATALGVEILKAPVKEVADAINLAVTKSVIEGAFVNQTLGKVNAGNARSRARMTILYGIAHHLNENFNCALYNPGPDPVRVRVVGTGNLSEDYIGYDTKGGDALCDFFPIGELFKSEVYQLLDFFKERGDITEEMIDRTPSAGLWDGQSDEAELGYTYNQMEPSIRHLLFPTPETDEKLASQIDVFVSNRHLANKHKHEAPPVFRLREFCD